MEFRSAEEIFILGLYKLSDVDYDEARRLYKREFGNPISKKRLFSMWSQEGLFQNSTHGGYRHGVRAAEFFGTYTIYGGDFESMRKNLEKKSKVTYDGLLQLCQKHRVPVKNKPPRPKTHKYRPSIHSGLKHIRYAYSHSNFRRAQD